MNMWNLTIVTPETTPASPSNAATFNPRKTLPGGVRLADVAALATTDEEPFLLKAARVISFGGVRVMGVRL